MEDEVMTKMWTTRRPLPQGKRPYCVMIDLYQADASA